MDAKEAMAGEQDKMAREREMSDTIGKAVGAHFNRFREEFGNELLGKMGEMMKQNAAQKQDAAPAQQRLTEEDLRQADAYFRSQGYAITPISQANRGQPAAQQYQEQEPEEPDYGDAIEDMVDTLRDSNPEMSRQEARSLAYSIRDEAVKSKKDLNEVFASKWDGEEKAVAPYRNAMKARVNAFWKARGFQLSPIDQQAESVPPSGKAKPPAPAGKPSMSIASQSPVNPSRATDTTDRDREVEKKAEEFENKLDGKS
jgi:hypothetical protein